MGEDLWGQEGGGDGAPLIVCGVEDFGCFCFKLKKVRRKKRVLVKICQSSATGLSQLDPTYKSQQP